MQTYMLSLCSDNKVVERLPADVLNNLDLLDIEHRTQAALTRIGPEELCIQGDSQMIIATATSLLDHKHQQYRQQREERRRLTTGGGMGRSEMDQSKIQDVVPDYTRSEHPQEHKEVMDKNDRPSPLYGHDLDHSTENKIDVIVPPRQSQVNSSAINPSETIDVIVPPRTPPTSETVDVMTPINPPMIKTSVKAHIPTCSSDIQKNTEYAAPGNQLVAHGGSSSSSSRSATTDIEPCIDPEPPIIIPPSSTHNQESIEERIKRQESFDRTLPKEEEIRRATLNDPREIMQKLGYSEGQVDQVIQQLGPSANTDDILGALVSQNKGSNSDFQRSNSPVQRDGRIKDVSDSSAPPKQPKDDADNLRTIIIDGSNVAMR